ncbi:MAG TPA: SDR family NAD(P)-dependent oxidoreductase [Gaiellaceae bacterium]|nr:SDR family NAD(P)-dependent oxidoreductase [Gaiellaceae bacterium]
MSRSSFIGGGSYGLGRAIAERALCLGPRTHRTTGGGRQVASALSYRVLSLQSAYCAGKAALRTFFESARVELEKERSGVDGSVILPGAINTPQFDRARQKIGLQPRPVPPIYEPEPFADAVLHCCERPIRELPSGGAPRSCSGGRSSRRVRVTSSFCAPAGRSSTRTSSSSS